MEVLFFVLCVLILYIYLVFPAAMALLAVAGEREGGDGDGFRPRVSFCIPAANEVDRIAAKLENTLASDYPPEKLEIIVASDGSTDGTDEAVRSFVGGEVRLLSLDGGGKTRTVNELSLAAGGDVIVMSDADVLISPNAIADLVGHFADDSVGAVCGLRSSRKEGPAAARHPAGLYNSYESFIKRGEGVLGRILGGDGALYALRRECFRPLPEHVPDDFVNILRVLERGRRVIYEKRAVSYEELPDSKDGLFTRRRRTVARGIRGLSSVRGLLNPLRFPLTAFLICSHKILRWGGGVLLFLLLLLSLLLAARPLFASFFAVQIVVYALSLAPPLPWLRRGAVFLRTMRYFLLSNFAATAGAADVLFGRDWSSWKVQRIEKGG